MHCADKAPFVLDVGQSAKRELAKLQIGFLDLSEDRFDNCLSLRIGGFAALGAELALHSISY